MNNIFVYQSPFENTGAISIGEPEIAVDIACRVSMIYGKYFCLKLIQHMYGYSAFQELYTLWASCFVVTIRNTTRN